MIRVTAAEPLAADTRLMSRFRELFGAWCEAEEVDLVRDAILLTCDSDGWISRRIVIDWSDPEEGERYRVLFVDDRKGKLNVTDAVFRADVLQGYEDFCTASVGS